MSTESQPMTRRHCSRNAAVKLPRLTLFVRLRSFSGIPASVSLSAKSR